MPRFFQIGDATSDTKGYAWAAGYGPLQNSMPFIHPKILERKRAYWKVNIELPGVHIDPGSNKWPDILGCGSGDPFFFVSERVVSSLRRLGLALARVTEMPIAEINSKALTTKPPPHYYAVETEPGIDVDLVATGFKVDVAGKAILNPPPTPWPFPYRYRLDSWNGADLFDYHHFGPTSGPYTNLLCTERIKRLAETEGWTNIRFKPIDVV